MLPLWWRWLPAGMMYGGTGRAMIGLFVGALLVAGIFTLLPGRIMHAVVFGS